MSTISVDHDIRKLSGRIGAEIVGIDIARELDDEVLSFITEALHQYKALVFRNVGLDDAAHQRFARYFGSLTTAHPTVASVEGQPNILPVDSEGGGRANNWHTDVTFVVAPPKASTLRSIVVPPYGGETLIANTAAAYRDLPPSLRDFADTLWAIHTNDYDYAKSPEALDDNEKARRATFVSTKYQSVHPVVRVHPVTGERALFIGGFAQRIVGLSAADSRDLLRLFQSYVIRPENIVRVQWQPNQLVLFDNRSTQHYGVDNYDDLPRRLHRVTVAGDRPVGVDGTQSYSIEGDASHYTALAN
ncbi:MAG: taurine dioxygenase [Acidimicrobiia bacterium]|nr:taurine dioxygenase [Acidimicrobiia bacterium]